MTRMTPATLTEETVTIIATTENPSTETQTTSTTEISSRTCFANAWYKDNNMDNWCVSNCAVGERPQTHCSCDPSLETKRLTVSVLIHITVTKTWTNIATIIAA